MVWTPFSRDFGKRKFKVNTNMEIKCCTHFNQCNRQEDRLFLNNYFMLGSDIEFITVT